MDRKTHARLEAIGLIIYMECDDEENPKLCADETENLLILRCDDDDPPLFKLIKNLSITSNANR